MPASSCANRPPPSSRASSTANVDGKRGGKHRQQTQRDQLVSERTREPRRKRDERRLIDVPPREMLRAGDEVQLVAKVSVAPGGGRRAAAPSERESESDHAVRRASDQQLRREAQTPDHIHAPSATFQSHHMPSNAHVAMQIRCRCTSSARRTRTSGTRAIAPATDAGRTGRCKRSATIPATSDCSDRDGEQRRVVGKRGRRRNVADQQNERQHAETQAHPRNGPQREAGHDRALEDDDQHAD